MTLTRKFIARMLAAVIAIALMPSRASLQTLNFRNYSVEHGLPFINVSAISQDSKGYLWTGGYGGLSRFNGKQFVNYSPKNGLANNSVTSIAQDSSGSLWIGTNNGISRLKDGAFQTFREKDGVAGNNINSVIAGRDGMVWFGTRDGLSRHDGKKFTNFRKKDGLKGNNVLSLFEDSKGNLWVGTANGVSRMTGGKFTSFDLSNGLCDSTIKAICEDSEGRIWLGTTKGACLLDPATGKVISLSVLNGLPDNDVRCMILDREDHIWIGTSRGVARFKGQSLTALEIGKDLNSNLVACLYEDFEGNIWIGTYSGLFRYRGDDFVRYDENDGLSNSFIFQLMRDKKGKMWIGTSGGGVNIYDGKKFTALTTREGLAGNTVNAGMEDEDGTLWFGTDGGLSRYSNGKFTNYTKKNGLISNSILSLLRDSRGTLWIGAMGGVTKYDGKTFEKYNLAVGQHEYQIACMLEDRKGNIWFGAYQGGLYLYDGKNFYDYAKRLGLRSSSYMSILQDRKGNMYLGTFDGVYMYDGQNLVQFSETDGLSSDLVYTMVFDNNEKTLWVGTNQGLNKIDIDEYFRSGRKEIEHYGKEEGFTGVESNTNGVLKDSDGSIWFGTVNGLIRYNPMAYRPNLTPPRTSITGFRLFYKDTVFASGIELPYDQNNISIEFIGISLTNPSKVKYKYILEGFDKKWSPETSSNLTTYSNLPPGSYRFLVKSCNNEGIWNETAASFSFVINAPFWKTWWFWASSSGGLLVVIYIGLMYRIQQIRTRERIILNQKIQMATNELKALRSQMNPHFLFNSLNSIQNYIMSSDPESASKYLSKFARLMRTILNNSERATVTIREEIEGLDLYLQLEVMRFEGKFDYKIEVDEMIDQDFFEIPTMLIQPYVENAILHGLVPRQSKGMLLVQIDMDKTHIICRVIDNGIGRKQSVAIKEKTGKKEHKSMGMRITRDRLAVLNNIHNSNLSVNISDLEDEEGNPQGTKIEIFVPIV
jgi:ligand-binding sensor domain-containing protein